MQLLKETEKYLQKLSSKILDAKAMTGHIEMETDDSRAVNLGDRKESVVYNEDDSAQASINPCWLFTVIPFSI